MAGKTLRIYFDYDIEWTDEAFSTVQRQAEETLTRVVPGFDWDNVAVTVYYYPGGIENDPRHGKYQRGEGFYADILADP